MKSQQLPKGPGPTAKLRVHKTEGDRWTWCYDEPGIDLTLHSNETFLSEDVARDWAGRAYPGVPFADDEVEEPENS